MAKINKTRFALLGILSLGPASGYDIKKMMERTTNHFWREGDGSIYPILKQLLEEDMVSCELANTETDKPKKIYSITEDGKRELQDWLAEYPAPSQSRNELMLKVFFGWNTDAAVTVGHLEKYRQQLQASIEDYKEIEKRFLSKPMTPDALHRFISLRGGITYLEASVKWCNEALGLLHEKRL